MTRLRSFGMKAALIAALVLGLAIGLLSQGAVASAQTTPQTGSATAGSSLGSLFLDKLAAALGIQRTALDSAVVSAGSATAAEAVQQGTLTQAQADALAARVQAGDYGALFGGRGGPSGGPKVAGLHEAIHTAAATALGITSDELRTALRDGQTLAQLAAANSTTEQAVIDAALAAAKTHLDAAVAAGTLTQAQADATYTQLQQQGANIVGHGHRGGSRGGPRGDRVPPTDSTLPAPAAAPDA